MESKQNTPGGNDHEEIKKANNDAAGYDDDTLGENTEDSPLTKGNMATDQAKKDGPRVETVTPDDDNGEPGPAEDK